MQIKTIDGYTPFGFQSTTIKSAIKSIQKHGGACVFDETGLGKTIVGATVAINMGKNILVVSPKVNQSSWKKILPSAVICTKTKITKGEYDFIIVDEAHNFGNNTNKSYQDLLDCIYFTGDSFPSVLLLSATPVNNQIVELVNMIKLIPFNVESEVFWLLGAAANNAVKIEKEYGVYERYNVDSDGLGKSMRQITKQVDLQFKFKNAIEDLSAVLKLFCFRTTRQDISKKYIADAKLMGRFPIIHKQKIQYKIDDKKTTKTIELLKKMSFAFYNIGLYSNNGNKKGLDAIMLTFLLKRLDSSVFAFKQSIESMIGNFQSIIDNGVLEMDGETIEVNEQFFVDLASDVAKLKEIQSMWANETDDEKLKELDNIINKENGKVIVFTEYVATQTMLVDYLSKKYLVIGFNGQTDAKVLETIQTEFDRNLDENSYKYKILVCTDALSEGVNLHLAESLVHFDMRWNPSRQIQREGRVNRLTKVGAMASDVMVHSFGSDIIVDSIIKLDKKLSNKTQLSQLVLDGKKEIYYYKEFQNGRSTTDNYGYKALKFEDGYIVFKFQCVVGMGNSVIMNTVIPKYIIEPIKHKLKLKQCFGFVFGARGVSHHINSKLGIHDLEKMEILYNNILYNHLFVLDGKKDIAKMFDKFWLGKNIPENKEINPFIP